ncbi:MAG: tetraacyldisaccharide 4'-kinase, partial [Planctomycetia bacterium]
MNDSTAAPARTWQEWFRRLVRGETTGFGPLLLRTALRGASLPYGAVVALRNAGYDAGRLKIHRAAVPVVSVGNLTVGGTGKTPFVEYLADWFHGRGLRAAILSRGYGSTGGPNDEALLLEENLPDVPHLQGKNRSTLADAAVVELESQVLLLDDGFQHRRLHRDLDVVLLDATDPWGGGGLLPGGLLREPARSLRRADVVVLTRCDQVDAARRDAVWAVVGRQAPKAVTVEASFRPRDLLRHAHPASP